MLSSIFIENHSDPKLRILEQRDLWFLSELRLEKVRIQEGAEGAEAEVLEAISVLRGERADIL